MKHLNLVILIALFFICFKLTGLEVDVNEIKQVRKIEFQNYPGPYTSMDTEASIRSIGRQLADVSINNEVFRYHMKYSIIHAVDDTSDDKFDSDIFSVDRAASVDHIRNIRFIISGYLQKKYGYTRKQGDTLALFLSYYNAVYRGNIEYFGSKYKKIVMNNIDRNNAGISTKYYEWAGNTRMLIPLTKNAQRGNISSLDTNELTEDKIIKEIRKGDDKNIEERKEMVKIEEKEIEEKKKEIANEKKVVEKEKKDIEKEKKQIEEEKKETKKKEEELKTKKEEVKDIKNSKVRKAEEDKIKKEEKKLEEKKAEIKKKEDAVKKKEDKVQNNEKKTETKKATIDKKQEKVAKEKENIKKDEATVKPKKTTEEYKKELEKKDTELKEKETELKEKEKVLKEKEDQLRNNDIDKSVYQDKFYYLKIKEYMEGGHYNNEMYAIDAREKKVILKSPVKELCGNRYDIFKEGVVVITFIGSHSSDHYLTLLDLDTLDIKIRGTDNIFWRSFIEIRDNFIYAIIKEDEDYYLGKFNNKMERMAKSEEKINNNTFITFYNDIIYINNEKKEIMILNKDDLKMIDTIKP